MKVIINPSAAPPLLTKREILQKEGVYASVNALSSRIRFVVNRNGECFIFGDICPIYESGNFDIDNDTRCYYPTNEAIVFTTEKNS